MTYGYWAVRAAVVDELDDGIGVVLEVCGECGIGEGIAVGCDRLFEIVGNSLGFRVT